MTPGICAAAGFIRDSQNYLFYTKGHTPGSLAGDVGLKLLSRSPLSLRSRRGGPTVTEDVCPELGANFCHLGRKTRTIFRVKLTFYPLLSTPLAANTPLLHAAESKVSEG
jgi:hypothetical protein